MAGIGPAGGHVKVDEMDTSKWQCQHKGVFPHRVGQSPAVVKFDYRTQRPRQVALVVIFTYLGFAVQDSAVSLAFFRISILKFLDHLFLAAVF